MITRTPRSGSPTVLLLGSGLVALVAVAATAVHAADGPHHKAIEARQANMDLYGYNLGVLSAMAREKTPYDSDRAASAAGNLDALANLSWDGYWPEGSDSEAAGIAENEALPAIWEDMEGFEEERQELIEATASLMGVAGDGLDALKGSINDVGGSCKGCHDDYRVDD